MNKLTLEIVAQPASQRPVTNTQYTFDRRGGAIGRNPEGSDANNWIIDDEGCVVSSHHADIVFDGEHYRIRDRSANGTFLHPQEEPVCKTEGTRLTDGQCLDIGDYIIQVGIVQVGTESVVIENTVREVALEPFAPPGIQESVAQATDSKNVEPSPEVTSTPEVIMPDVQSADEDLKVATPPVSDDKAFQAFMDALDIDESEQFNAIVGLATSHLVALSQRFDEVRRQFGLPVTRIKERDNNPIALSINTEDALHNLFVKQTPGFMAPQDAYNDALHSVRLHHEAMLVGMQAGFEHMLQAFSPEQLKKQLSLPETRSWLDAVRNTDAFLSAYEDYYQGLIADKQKGFQALFGQAFKEAYERATAQKETQS